MSETDVPFPDLTCITADSNSVGIIAPAYASECGELNAMLQYGYHQIQLYQQGYADFAERVSAIAKQEAHHLNVLGNMLYRLGVPPVYVAYPPYPANFYATRCISYARAPQKIFVDDIAAEQSSIGTYKSMLNRLTNECVAAVIKRILMDETAHLEEFKDMLSQLNKMNASEG